VTTGPVHGTWEPAPAWRWEDAFLSGNGTHGAMSYGDPADDRVIVTQHRLVRPNGSEDVPPPELAGQLAALQDALLAGDGTAGERFGAGHPLYWVQPFHPAFQTRLRPSAEPSSAEPPSAAGDYRRTADFSTGELCARRRHWRSQVVVSRADDVVLQQVTAPPRSVELRLDHLLPGAPADLAVYRTIRLHPGGAALALRVGYPGADRGYTGVTTLRTVGGRVTATGRGVRVTGARALLLVTRVLPYRAPDGPPDAARAWAELPTARYRELLARHAARHRPAYQRVVLDLAADPVERALPGSELLTRVDSPALLERLFAAGRYHLLSAAGLLPPRLTGLWTGDWDTAWSGALTTNANLNLQLASAVAADLPEVVDAHARFVRRQLPDWRDNARRIFGAGGIVAPSHTDGFSGHTRHFQAAWPLHTWTAGADWLLRPLLEADQAGTAVPGLDEALAEVAAFYAGFLTRRAPDGTVVVVPSYSPENQPADHGPVAVNATMDLAAARHALTTAAARHPDDPRAEPWRRLAAALPPYRINADGALAEWAWPSLADTYDHRHLSHLYPVWPLEEITPEDTPALAAAAHRALRLRGRENDSAHGHLHQALIAARLRDGDRALRALRAVLAADCFHDSLMSSHYPARDVYNADAAHALPAVLIELLAHSTPERLVLFPALPPGFPPGRLHGLRTRFGSRLDLTWNATHATAVLHPDRDASVTVLTGPSLPRPPDRVLSLTTGQRRVVEMEF
jgi:hypothetical protein